MADVPEPGEIWRSKVIGMTVRVKAISADRRVIVTDGTSTVPILMSRFLNPDNGWRRVGAPRST